MINFLVGNKKNLLVYGLQKDENGKLYSPVAGNLELPRN